MQYTIMPVQAEKVVHDLSTLSVPVTFTSIVSDGFLIDSDILLIPARCIQVSM